MGYKIQAEDGNIGKVRDLYFDDRTWLIRYIIVDTGGWLTGREVLISPQAAGMPNHDDEILPINLTKKQIEDSPGIEVARPVSRHYEEVLSDYYGWTPYWGMAMQPADQVRVMPVPFTNPGPDDFTTAPTGDADEPLDQVKDPNLRSLDEVEGYNLQASDGDIGHVSSFLLDDEHWSIRYMVVNTSDWIPFSKKVIIPLEWIVMLSYDNREVTVTLTKEQVKNSPEYDESEPVTREFEASLYEHYDRPKYWELETRQVV
jgi:sporulation protein YlmC with PRC-barrel domain